MSHIPSVWVCLWVGGISLVPIKCGDNGAPIWYLGAKWFQKTSMMSYDTLFVCCVIWKQVEVQLGPFLKGVHFKRQRRDERGGGLEKISATFPMFSTRINSPCGPSKRRRVEGVFSHAVVVSLRSFFFNGQLADPVIKYGLKPFPAYDGYYRPVIEHWLVLGPFPSFSFMDSR